MGLNLNPILRQELANLDKDTESRKTAMKALKSYVKDLDSKAIPSFLAQVSETKETNSLSGEYTISLYEILARVHGPNIVPQIDTIMSTIVKTLASSAGSFPLQQACSKVVPAIARYGIDPTDQEENKKRVIIHSLCKPLSDSLLCSQESLASGSALCLKALVDCDNWRFASDEMVNKVCQNVVVALDANSNQTHLHMGLVMALAKRNPLIVEAYARLLIHTGVRILGFGVKEGNSQKRLSAVQMINFLMKCLDPRSIYSEVELIVKEMERCQTDQMAYVRGAAYEAMVTSKRIAGELEGKMEKKGSCRSVTGSNFGGRKCSPRSHDDNESLSPESQTLGGSFSGGYDSPVESSPRSSCNFDGRSVNRKLWRSNGVVDISLKDGLFSGDTTVSDSPLVPYYHCDNGDNEFEGFVMGSLRNRRMQNTTPTSPQRQCCSRNMNAENFNIYSTPRKLISSLQYPDDMGLDHSDIQSPMLSRQNTKLRKQSSPTPVKQAMETIASSSTVMLSEETTPQSHMIMSSKKKKNMRYAKLMFAISFFVVVLFTSVVMFSQDDDVVYYSVPT
ncbi:protein SINE1 isoform X2 [Brassica rapa]|uniref:TORTIFOLIA1/SINE1-2 N-terminal domain-containing protein n=2 Tax=Brassica campestris TaxID=3711 RepID=M4F5B4_BRACM|nr:protein SINE1 isoform X2 [Brassica rapa]